MHDEVNSNGPKASVRRAIYLALVTGVIGAVIVGIWFASPTTEPAAAPRLAEAMPDLKSIERRRSDLWITVDLKHTHPDHLYVMSAGANLNRIVSAIAAGAPEARDASTLHVVFLAQDASLPKGTQAVRLMRLRVPMDRVRKGETSAPGQFNSLELVDQVSSGGHFGDMAVTGYCEQYRAYTPGFCAVARR